MKSRKTFIAAAVAGLMIGGFTSGALANDFYKGKTIRVAVGFSAGGGYDTYTRAVARHMGKHIPGNPEFVVENMTGAGSLIAANYTYNKADRDGTFLGVWNSSFVLYQALGDRAVRLDARKLGWIGAPVKGSPHCSVMAFTGLDSFEDILKSGKSLKMGATRAGSTYNDVPKILNQTIGTKFDVITGYEGTSKILLGMRSHELEGGCWGWESARVTARSMLNAKGDDRLIPVIIHRKWEDGKVLLGSETRKSFPVPSSRPSVFLFKILLRSSALRSLFFWRGCLFVVVRFRLGLFRSLEHARRRLRSLGERLFQCVEKVDDLRPRRFGRDRDLLTRDLLLDLLAHLVAVRVVAVRGLVPIRVPPGADVRAALVLPQADRRNDVLERTGIRVGHVRSDSRRIIGRVPVVRLVKDERKLH